MTLLIFFSLFPVFQIRKPNSNNKTLEILRVRVENAFQALKNDREMIRRAVGGLMNRANTCLERNGSHDEGY